jgi:diguanylate cyclase (GGDEF)-like protein
MHWWRPLWLRFTARFERHMGSRLVVLPVVLVGVGAYTLIAGLYLLLATAGPIWTSHPAWLPASAKILLALGAPVLLSFLWHRSRPSPRVLQVVDWFGAGIIAYSVVWMNSALSDLIATDSGVWCLLLFTYSRAFWGTIGTGLFIKGTVDLSRDLSFEWRERQRLEALMEFTRRITSLDHQTIVNEAVRHMHRLLEADACVLYLWNEEEQVLVPVAGIHDPDVYPQAYIDRMMSFRCPMGFGVTGWVMQSGTPYIAADVMSDSKAQAVPGWSRGEKSSLLTPLQVEGRRLGVVRLTRKGLNQFTHDDLDLVMSFAGQAALVLEHGRIVKELSELSITDGMTGLYNSRHFHHVITVELARASRSSEQVALVMIDSDSLKQLNDMRGHLRGDEHIRRIGRLLRDSIRISDYAFRYAGDEFLLLLPNTDPAEACVAAERIRLLVEEDVTNDDDLPVTVSIGIAVYPLHGADAEGLLSAADRAMYQSKRSGKNRVTVADVVLPHPERLAEPGLAGGKQ